MIIYVQSVSWLETWSTYVLLNRGDLLNALFCTGMACSFSWCIQKCANKSLHPICDTDLPFPQHHLQLVLLGDSGVGKSCIVLRFVRGQFDPTSKV